MVYIQPHVQQALISGTPVVALESTVISHGLPYPHNQEVALQLEAIIRAEGAVPATLAVVHGVPTIGLDEAQIADFAQAQHVLKLSRRDLGYAIAHKRHGATTVAATMALAAAAGIQVFATGGIGGVHRGATQSWDVSADLVELSRTPVLVVCAGAKAILDLSATMEYLETLSVPVVGYQTNELPAFYTAHSGLVLTQQAEHPGDVARQWRAHQAWGNGAGLLLTVPPPQATQLTPASVEAAIERALEQASTARIRGSAVTPFLLDVMARETHGESIATNTALLAQNARVAAQVAVALVQEIA